VCWRRGGVRWYGGRREEETLPAAGVLVLVGVFIGREVHRRGGEWQGAGEDTGRAGSTAAGPGGKRTWPRRVDLRVLN
jgi:hypothetical protein